MNMFKWRYTNILPVNFRHEFMIKVTKLLLQEVEQDVERVISSNNGTVFRKVPADLKSKVELIFAGRFWYSNVACFNEIKRYFKN